MESRLETGAAGWQYPSWSEDFYPEELPPEWRLAFYANEFRFTLVPWHAWSDASDATLAQWSEDIEQPFRFFLQLPLDHLDRVNSVPESLLQVTEGLVITNSEALTAITDTLRSLAARFTLHLDIPVSGTMDYPDNILPCWHDTRPGTGVCQLSIISDPTLASDLRALREHIENFMSLQPHNSTQFLVFDYETLSVETLRNAMTIASLLPV